MAAESCRVVVLMIVAVAATALQLTSASSPVTYTVGDSVGWTVPADGAAAYQTWAKKHSFTVGDILVFNFINGTHNVAEVTETAYNTCNAATTQSLFDSAPVRITLTTTGQHFFICTFPGHCSMGQQVAIDVAAATTPPPPSSPATPSPSATPVSSPPTSRGSLPASSPSAPTATPPFSPTTNATPPSSHNAAPAASPTAASPSTTVTPTPSSSASLPPSIAAAPSPAEAATPPRPGNSAVRLGMAGNVAVVLSVILAFL